MHFELYADMNQTEALCVDRQDCIVFLSYFAYLYYCSSLYLFVSVYFF